MLLSGTLVASLATLVIVQKILLRAIYCRNIRRGLGRATMKLLISIVYKNMYTLYIKPGCPFCEKTLRAIDGYDFPITIKETTEDGVVEELIEHGGKKQVPYLIDHEKDVSMYDSGAIISYLVGGVSGDASDGGGDEG